MEMPYTLPQDFTLFVLMEETSIDIWERKLDWIARNGGMALFNTHPDYMHFGERKRKYDEYPVDIYIRLLDHIKTAYKDQYWNVLPRELAGFVRNRLRKQAT
jgi:hypothetical protein